MRLSHRTFVSTCLAALAWLSASNLHACTVFESESCGPATNWSGCDPETAQPDPDTGELTCADSVQYKDTGNSYLVSRDAECDESGVTGVSLMPNAYIVCTYIRGCTGMFPIVGSTDKLCAATAADQQGLYYGMGVFQWTGTCTVDCSGYGQ
ncbi:hypothetical protein V7x_26180 [Crateriforma conspicua]|uniref:Uncharacterized protein n=1 Tax=Crateriforma conspicua TaxID=2527996 RepID=A0A5C6FXC5_9PLAN|nr:hypothetical protein V7x_26180 [Crateriforma conspicua]